MTVPRDARRLRDMREDIDRVVATLDARGRESFDRDPDVQDATLWRQYRLADTATQLSPDLCVRHPEIDWNRVRGFRNFAAHGYRRLAIPLVARILEHDVPVMATMVDDDLRRLRELESARDDDHRARDEDDRARHDDDDRGL